VFATKTYYALTYNNILKANDVNEKDLRYPSYVVNESQYNQLQLKKHMENYSLSTKEDAYPNDYKQLNNADKEKEETKLRNKEIPDNLESYREQKYPQKNQTLNTEQNNEGQLPFIHLTRPGEEQQIQNLYKIPQYSIINNKNLSNKSREEFDRESAIDKYNA
jgi:hypothetical protein